MCPVTANPGLTEGTQLLAGVQREVVAVQVRVHAVRRPECRNCGTTRRVKDFRAGSRARR
jgi:hypothetical protein